MLPSTPAGPFTAALDALTRRRADVAYAAPLARYSAARVGGLADVLVTARDADELAEIVTLLWQQQIPFTILGGGSNVLISDAGVRGVVIVNRCPQGVGVRFEAHTQPPTVWAEAGVNFGALARQAAVHGLSGLEWAAGIPGTVGGAVVGNAGAHGGDMAGSLIWVEILQPQRQPMPGNGLLQRQQWPVERLGYTYRSSILKPVRPLAVSASPQAVVGAVVLAAQFRLAQSTPEAVTEKMDGFTAYRRRTQPPGASMGSMFKNPPGDSAGRLIDAAGLKGTRIGQAEISPQHANFFINHGSAAASDIRALIELARKVVFERFGVALTLEVELIGEWEDKDEK